MDAAMNQARKNAPATWRSIGRPTFNLDEDLAAALLLSDIDIGEENTLVGEDEGDSTNIRGITGAAFNLPFPAFVLRLPWNIAYAENASARLLLVYEAGPGMYSIGSYHDADCLPGCCCEAGTSMGGRIASETHRLVLAFLCWYANLAAEERPQPRRPRAYTRRQHADRSTIFNCVSKIKLDRRVVEHAKNPQDPQYAVRARFIVRGHWRNQAVGAGRTERRMIWIAPFWKGDESLEAVQHLYESSGGSASAGSLSVSI